MRQMDNQVSKSRWRLALPVRGSSSPAKAAANSSMAPLLHTSDANATSPVHLTPQGRSNAIALGQGRKHFPRPHVLLDRPHHGVADDLHGTAPTVVVGGFLREQAEMCHAPMGL